MPDVLDWLDLFCGYLKQSEGLSSNKVSDSAQESTSIYQISGDGDVHFETVQLDKHKLGLREIHFFLDGLIF